MRCPQEVPQEVPPGGVPGDVPGDVPGRVPEGFSGEVSREFPEEALGGGTHGGELIACKSNFNSFTLDNIITAC